MLRFRLRQKWRISAKVTYVTFFPVPLAWSIHYSTSMTLILTAMNPQYAVQVSDCRLTNAGSVMQEEHNKCFSLTLPGFRLTVAFTGLAIAGRHETAGWLIERLQERGKTTSAPIDLLEGLANDLTAHFISDRVIRSLPIPTRRLDITVTGYNYSLNPPAGLAAEITNMGDPEGRFRAIFSSEIRPLAEPWTWVGVFGSYAAVGDHHVQQIREALKKNIPPRAMVSILENTIRKIADDPRSANTIGKHLDSIIIESNPKSPVVGNRSYSDISRKIVFPASVNIDPRGGVFSVQNLAISAVEASTAPLAVPKVHRNAPCPCGSGKKYRFCHRDVPKVNGLPSS